MPALGAGIHVFCALGEDVDGRDKPGHDVRPRAGTRGCVYTSSGQGTMVDFTVFIAIASFTAREIPASSNG
jgi:hypothetical protein